MLLLQSLLLFLDCKRTLLLFVLLSVFFGSNFGFLLCFCDFLVGGHENGAGGYTLDDVLFCFLRRILLNEGLAKLLNVLGGPHGAPLLSNVVDDVLIVLDAASLLGVILIEDLVKDLVSLTTALFVN